MTTHLPNLDTYTLNLHDLGLDGKNPPVHVTEVHNANQAPTLSHLTLAEKVSLLSGSSLTTTIGVLRVGIPSLNVSDSINGVRGSKSHLEDTGTACFPSTTCLASTWNKPLMHDFGRQVGRQARLKDVQVVIGPNINLHRDPRGGRNFEMFSEDPLLTGKLAAAIVNGMQSEGVGACAKHFVANETETKRRIVDTCESPDGRTMRELYMKAFEYMLRDSDPVAIMMAYNKLQSSFCSQSSIIRDVLRKTWQYDGCVMSDWYGTHAGPESISAGLDLEMPGPSVFRGPKLEQEVRDGLVAESDIDRSVRSVLKMIDRTTLKKNIELPDRSRTSSMARTVASEGIVLLKNEHEILPVDLTKRSRIAVIGSAAEHATVTGGGSAAAHPEYTQSFLSCLREIHPIPASITYAQGFDPHVCTPTMPLGFMTTDNGSPGMEVTFYNNGVDEPVCVEYVNCPQTVMLGYLKPGLHDSGFHFIVRTHLRVPKTARYRLGAQITGDVELRVDDEIVLKSVAPDANVEDFLFQPKKLERTTEIILEANHRYSLTLRIASRPQSLHGEPTPHAAKLLLHEVQDSDALIAEAVAKATDSDVSIVFCGRTGEHESEGFDLDTIALEDSQVALIEAVSAVAPATVLVLHHGNPIDLSPVVTMVDGIFAAHFPGQEGARALLDLILGNANPSGKLATSWPLRWDQSCVPTFDAFPGTNTERGPEVTYTEGLQMGYRHPLSHEKVRFGFGYGLSYSSYIVESLQVHVQNTQSDWRERTLSATVTVTNTGSRVGSHVVQLYVVPPRYDDERAWRPIFELVAFAKVELDVGEQKEVALSFLERDVVSTWDTEKRDWIRWSGEYEFVVADGVQAVTQAKQVGSAFCYFA